MSVLVHSDVDVLEPAQDEDENIIYILRSLLGLLPMFPLSVQRSVRVICRLSVYSATCPLFCSGIDYSGLHFINPHVYQTLMMVAADDGSIWSVSRSDLT